MTSRQLSILALTLVLIGLAWPLSASAQDAPAEFFLSCDPDSFDYIYSHYWLDFYITCSVSHGGQSWPNCRMRIRGDSSRSFPKKSLKVKTDGELFWNGNDTVNFNADYVDLTYFHSVIASRLFREAGVPCFEASHARLFLNGDFLGLYVNVENMDEAFLAARGMDPDGNLYKAARDGASLSIWDDVPAVWEKKTNEAAPWDDLHDLIEDLNYIPDAFYYLYCLNYLDYQEMLSILAMNMLLKNGSTYYHNYYMYHDVNGSGKWQMFPWDVDKSFGYYDEVPYFYSTGYDRPDNPFHERALLSPMVFGDLWDRVHVLADSLYNRDYLDPLIDSLTVVLESSVAADTTDQIDDLAEWHDRIAYEQTGSIEPRLADLDMMLQEWPHSFFIDRQPEAFQDSVLLTWRSSVELEGDPVSYRVRFSADPNWPDGATWTYSDIPDTFFLLPELPPEGMYHFEVAAMDGEAIVRGFDSPGRFFVVEGTDVPAVIETDYLMDAAGSPYNISGEVLVAAAATLTVTDGVEILFGESASLRVAGQVHFSGSEAAPIRLRADPGAQSWGCLSIDSGSGPSSLSHVIFVDASAGSEPDWEWGALNSRHTDLTLDHLRFESCGQCIHTYGGDITLRDSEFPAGNGMELTNFQLGSAVVERCRFFDVRNNGDAIDFDGVAAGSVIRGCYFEGSTDDLIDLGEATALIEDNILIGADDNAVTAGENSTATLRRNVIIDCHWGVEAKNSSAAIIEHCTFFGVDLGVRCWEKYAGLGGGDASVNSSIFSQCAVVSEVDALSSFAAEWSICDSESLPGEGNLQGDPALFAPESNDCRLTRGSPCIDAGDPAGPPDPDASAPDMGALPYNLGPESVVINEINYHSAPDFDTEDWVELYNPTAHTVDLSGTSFRDSDDLHSFEFEGASIPPDGFLVLCRSTALFGARFPGVENVVGDMDFGFNASGDILRFYDEFGVLLDFVNFDDAPPWPLEPDGLGPTLELLDPGGDNNDPANWAASLAAHGTPGAVNSALDPTGAAGSENPRFSTLVGNHPNPFNPTTTLRFGLARDTRLRLSVHDVRGRLLALLADGPYPAGWHEIPWRARDRRGRELPSGVYLLRMETPDGEQSRKLILLR